MTNAFAVQMFATQLRMLLQQEGCSADELEVLFRQRWGVPFSDDQEASLQAALIEVTGQSRHLESFDLQRFFAGSRSVGISDLML